MFTPRSSNNAMAVDAVRDMGVDLDAQFLDFAGHTADFPTHCGSLAVNHRS